MKDATKGRTIALPTPSHLVILYPKHSRGIDRAAAANIHRSVWITLGEMPPALLTSTIATRDRIGTLVTRSKPNVDNIFRQACCSAVQNLSLHANTSGRRRRIKTIGIFKSPSDKASRAAPAPRSQPVQTVPAAGSAIPYTNTPAQTAAETAP